MLSDYKNIIRKKTNINIYTNEEIEKSDNNSSFFKVDDDITNQCLQLIHQYYNTKNSEGTLFYEAFCRLELFIQENFRNISPSIFVQTDFLKSQIEYFKNPTIETKDLCIKTLKYLTQYDDISRLLVDKNAPQDLMQICSEKIPYSEDMDETSEIFQIMINMLKNYLNIHDDSELFIDSISSTSNYRDLLSFITCCIRYSKYITYQEKYINIMLNILDKLGNDEFCLSQCFMNINYLVNKCAHDNCFILNPLKGKTLSLFQSLMRYFDLETHINNKKIMIPLLTYIGYTFSLEQMPCIHPFSTVLYQSIDLRFYSDILHNSTDDMICERVLYSIYQLLYIECLQQELGSFASNIDMLSMYIKKLREGTSKEKLFSFLIICFIIQKYPEFFKFLFENSDILFQCGGLFTIVPEKVLYIFCMYYDYMGQNNCRCDAISLIQESGIIEEAQNFLINNQENTDFSLEIINQLLTYLTKQINNTSI